MTIAALLQFKHLLNMQGFKEKKIVFFLFSGLIANEQAEQKRPACEAASLMPREVLQQAEKFSIVL